MTRGGVLGIEDDEGGVRVVTDDDFELETEEKILIPVNIYSKMFRYANATRSEISGFGKVKTVGDIHTVTEVRIFRQVCTPGHTNLSSKTMTDFYLELAKNNENPRKWNLWWHSHYNFGAFFSGEDDGTIRELSLNATLYSVCINQAGMLAGRKDRAGHETKIPVVVVPEEDSALDRAIKREVKQKVTVKKFKFKLIGGMYEIPRTTFLESHPNAYDFVV